MRSSDERLISPAFGSPPQYPIESVDNALRLLLLLQNQPSIRVTGASEYLGVATSTAHRLFGMLRYRGFLRQNQVTKAYEPGPSLSAISLAIRRQVDVRALVRPALEELSQETGETVHFAELDGSHVSFLDAIESPRAVRVASREGQLLPANCTATGKALLSQLSNDAVREIFPQNELPSLTNNSISTWGELEKTLSQIRHVGYATSSEESEDGVMSVAVPIQSPSGALYGVNVSVPAHRMTAKLRSDLVKIILVAAEKIEAVIV